MSEEKNMNQCVFVDKTAFMAFMNPENPQYIKARSLFLELDDLERPLVTTNPIVFHTHEWLRDEFGYEQAQFFMNSIEKAVHRGTLQVLSVNKEFDKDAKSFLIEQSKYEFSLLEAETIVVLLKNQMKRIFTFNAKFHRLPDLYTDIKIIPSLQ